MCCLMLPSGGVWNHMHITLVSPEIKHMMALISLLFDLGIVCNNDIDIVSDGNIFPF